MSSLDSEALEILGLSFILQICSRCCIINLACSIFLRKLGWEVKCGGKIAIFKVQIRIIMQIIIWKNVVFFRKQFNSHILIFLQSSLVETIDFLLGYEGFAISLILLYIWEYFLSLLIYLPIFLRLFISIVSRFLYNLFKFDWLHSISW